MLVLCAMSMAKAQSAKSSPAPAWSTSKDVNRFSNRQLFENESLKKSHITVKSSAYPGRVVSKGVHAIGIDKEAKPAGNVRSEYPSWIISRPVQRVGK